MFIPSLWLLFHFLMVCLTSRRSFRLPSQLLTLTITLDLGALHLLTLPFLFGGSHIPQMNPNVGSLPFHNPRIYSLYGWMEQPSWRTSSALTFLPPQC
jgi:hypothetical protein